MIVTSSHHQVIFGSLHSAGLLKKINEHGRPDKVFLLTDSITSKTCLPRFVSAHKDHAQFRVLEFEAGEENKTIETCKYIWQALLQMGATRKSVLVNLGGGVVTDLGGFVAGTFKRGIDYYNIPTTLLAQADASVGGKTAVDLDGLKNQVGLFYEPQAVFIDVDFLSTLSKREWLNGFAEMIKHALLENKEAWEELAGASITDNKVLEQLLFRSVSFKSKIVSSDAKETGLRKILNFGHTIGHALETFFLEADKPHLKHGEAVVAGMIVELFLSEKKMGLSEPEIEPVINFLREYYEKISFEKTDFVRLIEIMRTDKKNRGNEINFTLLKNIGEPVYDQHVSPIDIEWALNRYRLLA
jgi:3-dehydroquinate synthase